MVKLKTLVAPDTRWMGALLFCCAMGIAGQSVASDYDVEVLVFENIGSPGTEHHPEDPGRPDIGSAAGFPSSGLTLGDLARRLQSSPNHRLLAHQSWRQPGLGPSSAKPVALVQTLEGTGTLFGTITLIRRRYLHADVDLWFETGDTLEQARMQQSRRMRSDELHYLDHPRLGVIIIARPVG
jgi:hypothetical protein